MSHTVSPDGVRIINEQAYPSWIQDENTGFWFAPVKYPNDGLFYEWNEESLSWARPEPIVAEGPAVE